MEKWAAGARIGERFEIAAITVAELWHGVERATGMRKAIRERYLKTILELMPIIHGLRVIERSKSDWPRPSIRVDGGSRR
jgi:hypothetical protein